MKTRVHSFALSLDGFGAGPDQTEQAPMGRGGERLHPWVFDTAYGRAMIGQTGGSTGIDNDWLLRGDVGIGATVMGRNMFGPVRGPWGASEWTGWWGDVPPYHHPVFVLTHEPRPPLEMDGGTTFHFVTDGLDSALAQAREAADGQDVRIGGGVSTVREALRRGLVDELHVVIVPTLLREGEPLWADLGTWPEGYTCTRLESSEAVTHVLFERS